MCGPSHKDGATEWEDKGPGHRLGALFYSCGSKRVRARSGWHTPWWEVINSCHRMAMVTGHCRKKTLTLGCLLGAALPLCGISEAAFQVQ